MHYFVEWRRDLEARIAVLNRSLRDDAPLWISWPKKSSGRPTDLTEDVLREVLLPLGLVDVKVGNGVIVRSQTPPPASQESVMVQAGRNQWAEIDDELNIELDFNAELPPFSLLQTRLLLEPETAALAARHATDEELAGIRAAYEQNCRDNRAGSATHPGDRLFHIRIAQASGNPAYAFIIGHLLGHRYGSMFRVLQRHYTPDDMPHRSELEHRAILAAIEARDVRGARKAMKAHLDEVIAIFARAQ